MIVTNRNRTTAVVIRHDGHTVTLVPMKSGKLSACNISHESFSRDWRETAYSLANALERFLRHARQQGASQEVLKGLQRLQQRDRWVVASLF
jgi:hypothetical protein